MNKEFHNKFLKRLRNEERLNEVEIIKCDHTESKVLAIKDEEEIDNYIHLHNNSKDEDQEDIETFNHLKEGDIL